MSEPRRHHYHARSVLKQWSTPEANPLLDEPFDNVPYGLKKFGLLVVYDLRARRIMGRTARETCAVDDLYTLVEMSPLARGLHRAHTEGRLDELRGPAHGPRLRDRLATLGEEAIALKERRRAIEVDLYGEIDSAASSAFNVFRTEQRPTVEHLLAVHKYLRSQLSRTPWALAALPAQMASIHQKLRASFPVDGERYATVLEAIIEHTNATASFDAQRRGPKPGRDIHIQLIKPGWGAPPFVFGDHAGCPWRSLEVRGGRVRVHLDGPPVHITYPISPQHLVRMTGTERDDTRVVLTFERKLAPVKEVQRVNTALAGLSREIIVLPARNTRGLFLPGLRLM